ncbi:hypothetical protein [Brevundimonas sp.]|uniref:hypothetical protein n=1 Tax=Brevundimonas sp. TaxID=1871086 RepID=UPI0035AEDF61
MARSLNSLAVAVVVALAGAAFVPAAASAGESQAVGRYRVQARVPVACWVRPSGTLLAGGGLSGSVVEACNAPGGFTVRASYRPLGELERASLSYGGRVINLSKTGEQDLRRSSVATIRSVNYQFEDVDLAEPLVLSLTIQPL